MGLFDGIKSILTGGGALGSLVRTVAMGYVLTKVTASANKDSNNSQAQLNAPGIDNGVRLQVPPASNQKIPVLYGGAYFGGIITEAVMSNSNQRMTYVVTLAEKTGNLLSSSSATSYTFGDIIWDDQKVFLKADGVTVDYTVDRQGNRDQSLRDLVKIYCYAGSSASANQRFPIGYSGTAVNAYSVVPGWNSGYAMNNLIFAVVEVNYSGERNVKGIANQLAFQVTSSMNKPGDVIYDYLTNGLYGANIAVGDIDTTSLSSLNTYAGTSVTYTDESGSQTLPNRYQINGLVNTDGGVMQNVEEVANSAGSWLSYSILTGKWGIIINKAGTSVASFDDSNIVGGISVSGTGLSELYNSVKVEYPNRDIRDQTDYVSIAIPAEDRNANELDKALQLSYNYINEPVQAQLLGFIELKQSRVDLVITFNTDYSLIGLAAGEIISVTNSKLNFTNKLFRIISIAEVDSDEGLQCQITALEYDADVYDEDLSRFTRTLNNNVITVGNIGIPGTPTITTFENVSRPHLTVSTTAPTGIVEGMEYWLSNDTGVGEAQRSYRLIATKVAPNGNANVRGTFTTGETVTLDYDTLGNGNLVVKTRAYNSTTVGPFSSNSAITSFTATQIPDAISPNTAVYDELGGLATTLGIISLLNNVDDLLKVFGGEKGIFDTVKDILFPDNNGVDDAYEILANSETFNNQIQSIANDPNFLANVGENTANIALTIRDEGLVLTNNASSINFVGSGINATANGNIITVNVSDTVSSAINNGDPLSPSQSTGLSKVVKQSSSQASRQIAPNLFSNARFFPCVFGSGETMGSYDTRIAVYTHHSMMISSVDSNFGYAQLPPLYTPSGSKKLYVSASGEVLARNNSVFKNSPWFQPIHDAPARYKHVVVASSGGNITLQGARVESTGLYNFGDPKTPRSVNVTNATPVYNDRWTAITPEKPSWFADEENFAYTGAIYGTILNLYYSICTYNNELPLDQQSWSAWVKIGSDGNEGVNEGNIPLINIPPIFNTTAKSGNGGTTYSKSDTTLINFANVSFTGNTGCTSSNNYQSLNFPNTATTDYVGKPPPSADNTIRCNVDDAVLSITLGANQIIAFGVSAFNIPSGTLFSSNTIFGSETVVANVNSTVYTFPGYTPITGQLAQVQQKSLRGNRNLQNFTSSDSNVTVAGSASIGAIWPDDIPNIVGTNVSPVEIGVSGCPTLSVKIN